MLCSRLVCVGSVEEWFWHVGFSVADEALDGL
jgi:hypothetical protein